MSFANFDLDGYDSYKNISQGQPRLRRLRPKSTSRQEDVIMSNNMINIRLIKLLCIFIFSVFILFNNDYAYADMTLKYEIRTDAWISPKKFFYALSKEDKPITITGFIINRGNTLSTGQKLSGKRFKFDPITLKFGQSEFLFSVGVDEDVLEVELITDNGNYKFNFD